jgi:hypothetical protein
MTMGRELGIVAIFIGLSSFRAAAQDVPRLPEQPPPTGGQFPHWQPSETEIENRQREKQEHRMAEWEHQLGHWKEYVFLSACAVLLFGIGIIALLRLFRVMTDKQHAELVKEQAKYLGHNEWPRLH